jgi:hypothetical protein
MRAAPIFPIACIALSLAGCQSTSNLLIDCVLNSIFPSSETVVQKNARESNEEAWKQHWRNDPNDMPHMTAAFSDEKK